MQLQEMVTRKTAPFTDVTFQTFPERQKDIGGKLLIELLSRDVPFKK
jgi:hypothetical protein